MYQFRNIADVVNSFDVYELSILQFELGLSFDFFWCSLFFVILLFLARKRKHLLLIFIICCERFQTSLDQYSLSISFPNFTYG